ncbi:dienelactone hydrolase family protein [Erythrobacter sp. W53]|uniref:dienelactone hydrolase family protein n=1 Tax=Erythrobacter sp. W53 TaxID=3425947 RepID=UPI003D769843
MCDEKQLQTWAKDTLSRREFGAFSGAAALAACTPGEANGTDANTSEASGDVTESSVSFETEDGTMDAFFVHPSGGPSPAVIFWPDIASIREAKRNMARRLAGEGYAVLVVNPYYRDVAGEQFADFAAWIAADGFDAESGFALVAPWREKLDADAIGRDTAAIVEWLDGQDAVDTSRGVGAEGYCMGGPFTVWSTAAVPERVKAAASFHGGGLVRGDDPKSPHNMLDQAQAEYLIAVAQDDDAAAPDDKAAFAEAAEAAGRPAVVEVYEGDHGWTVPDSPAYAQAAAEKAFADKLELYARAL